MDVEKRIEELTALLKQAKESLRLHRQAEQREELEAALAKGGVRNAMGTLRLTRAGVYCRMKRLGVKCPRRTIPQDAHQFIITHTLSESARHFLVSYEAVRQWCKRNNVTPKRRVKQEIERSGICRAW